ncbi:MAG: hypothetical protein FWE46_01710 [Coriobacteriia bacterium]|nr:hypothetical protein [Coriobacteriia bacterium]MCL2537294.1 hypothetical protein [Coriobacteriia bacterium]
MNACRRAVCSVKRRWGYFAILLISVFLLSILLSGALLVESAVSVTDLTLRAQMPAIATLTMPSSDQAWEEMVAYYGEEGELPGLTVDHIREIGALEYVDDFDYSLEGVVYSNSFVRAFDEAKFAHIEMLGEDTVDLFSLSHWRGWQDTGLEHFFLKGVRNPYILDIKTGLIELSEGRSFTASETEALSYVTVASRDFLEANGYSLGDFVTFDQRIYLDGTSFDEVSDPLHTRPVMLELVGVFENQFIPEDMQTQDDVFKYINQINQLYVPIPVIDSLVDTMWEAMSEHAPEVYMEALAAREIEEPYHHGHVLFYSKIQFI